MAVEDPEPALRLIPAEFECRRLSLVAAALQMREKLRIAQSVAEIPIEVRIDPIHHLVDLSALLKISRIGRRTYFVGKVLQDRGAFRQAQVAVLEQRQQGIRIDIGVGLRELRTRQNIDQSFFD